MNLLDSPKLEDHLGLAHSIAKKFVKNNERVQDSEEYAEACIALWQAIEKCKIDKSWSSFAYKTITNRIVRHVKYSRRLKRNAIFDYSQDLDKISDRTTLNKIDSSILETLLADDKTDNKFHKANNKLLRMVFLENKKPSELTQKLNCTRSAIYLRINKAIARIQKKHKVLIEKLNEI